MQPKHSPQSQSHFSFPAQMKRKGVDETNLTVPYPFRDDGMLLWKAISQWVEEYLRVYYG